MSEIKIICTRQSGIWRGGVFHPAGMKDWPAGSLTDAQLEVIRKEPLLVVQDGIPAAADTPSAAENAAMALLRPFLRGPESEARAVIASLVISSPDEQLPVVDKPVVPESVAELVEKETTAAVKRRKA